MTVFFLFMTGVKNDVLAVLQGTSDALRLFLDKKQNARDLMEAPVVTFVAEPQFAENPEPKSQPAPEPATDHKARNRPSGGNSGTLLWRPTVAHVQWRENRMKLARKLEWELLIERAGHQQERQSNGHSANATPAEVQASIAAEDEKKAQEEHRR